ncbi:MAG TPA: hypothetical protein VGE43_01035 [Acidimicrobiales bacterium]
MDDLTNADTGSGRLRALTHDLRGAVGALDHQTQLLATPDLPADLHARSLAVLEANIAELRRVLGELEALVPGSTSARP